MAEFADDFGDEVGQFGRVRRAGGFRGEEEDDGVGQFAGEERAGDAGPLGGEVDGPAEPVRLERYEPAGPVADVVGRCERFGHDNPGAIRSDER